MEEKKKRNKTVTLLGERFPSIAQAWASKKVTVSYGKLKTLAKGTDTLSSIAVADKRLGQVVLNGEKYESIAQAARATGFHYNRIAKAIQRKRSRIIELADNGKASNRKSLPVTINGTRYSSIYEASLELNISTSTISRHIAKNQSREFTFDMQGNKRKVIINGIEYSSVSEAALRLNKSSDCIHTRVKRFGDSFTL